MKKILLPFVVALLSLASCTDYTDDFNTINNRLDALEQTLPSIEEQIETLNIVTAELEKVDEELKKVLNALKSDIQANAKDIEVLETQAEILETRIAALNNYVNSEIVKVKDAAAAAYATIDALNDAKSELNALQATVANLSAELNAKIDSVVSSLTSQIDQAVKTLNDKIAELEARLKAVEDKVENLLARIQSVSYIPKYEDGKATLKYISGVSQVELDFKVSPKECAAELAKIWESAVKVDAVYTETRAVSFVDMPIVKFEADVESGVISIIASGENLSEEYFAGTQSASVALAISDGNSSVTSEYILMVAKEVGKNQLLVPANQIWYTSTDGKIVEPTRTDAFDVKIVSNKYEKGMGILRFEGPVTQIYLYAFCNSETNEGALTLESIILPNSLEKIGEYAFYGCSSLKNITIPPSVTNIKSQAFESCTNLTRVDICDLFAWCKIHFTGTLGGFPLRHEGKLYLNEEEVINLTIPSGITSLNFGIFSGCSSIVSVDIPHDVTRVAACLFNGCKNLTKVYCRPVIPPAISLTDNGFWSVFSGNAKGRMIYVPRESVNAYKSADGWKDYADYIVGYDF